MPSVVTDKLDTLSYASARALPIGLLETRSLDNGIEIRVWHRDTEHGPATLLALCPTGGVALVRGWSSDVLHCFTCSCEGAPTLEACWQCGEARHLPLPGKNEFYARL